MDFLPLQAQQEQAQTGVNPNGNPFMGLDPQTQQLLLSTLLRNSQQEMPQIHPTPPQPPLALPPSPNPDILGASQNAHAFDNLAAVAHMANNPGLATAADDRVKNQQGQFSPVPMGQTGFALPGSGQFAASPMWVEDHNAQRDLLRSNAELAGAVKMSDVNNQAAVRLLLGNMMNQFRTRVNPEVLDKLNKEIGGAQQFNNTVASFDDSFAGPQGPMPGFLTSAKNAMAQSNIPFFFKDPESQAQANWWQNYNGWMNSQLHSLYMSRLTPAEIERFKTQSVQPGMSPDQIKTRLAQQQAWVNLGVNRYLDLLQANNWNVQGVQRMPVDMNAIKIPGPGTPATPAAPASAPVAPPTSAPVPGAAATPMPTQTGATATDQSRAATDIPAIQRELARTQDPNVRAAMQQELQKAQLQASNPLRIISVTPIQQQAGGQ